MPEDDFVLSKRHSYVSVENLLINVLFYNSINTFRWLIDEKVNYKSRRCIIFNWIFNISFYSPRLKFDVLENPNKGNKVNRSEQVNKSNNHAENPKPKEGVGTWVGKILKCLLLNLDKQIVSTLLEMVTKIMCLKTKQLLHCFN